MTDRAPQPNYNDSGETTTFGEWLNSVPDTYKAVIAFVTVFSAGMIAAVTLMNFLDLPTMVEENTRRLASQRERIEELEEQQDEWRPLMKELPDMIQSMQDLQREIRQANCLTIAERQDRPWQDCLNVSQDLNP